MSLFRKKKEEKPACCCGGNCTRSNMQKAESEKLSTGVKVLGSGCAKCNALETAVKEAMAELNINAEIEHVTDFAQIASYGVMSTPALVVNGKVVSYGKVLKKQEAIDILKKQYE